MRFIGRECDGLSGGEVQEEVFRVLDAMDGYRSGFDYDVRFMHHDGLIDVEPVHRFWGRFMRMDAPVPEGFLSFDFVPEHDGRAGAPYLSQFAFARFSGDHEAMHKREGYDINAMYDVTRNMMLSQGIDIPYPDKYWTAEVFLDGYGNGSTAYMFSAGSGWKKGDLKAIGKASNYVRKAFTGDYGACRHCHNMKEDGFLQP